MAITISINFPPSLNDLTSHTGGTGSLGIRLQLLIGPSIVNPAPAFIVDAIKSIEVTNSDRNRSGFQITFSIGRGSTVNGDNFSGIGGSIGGGSIGNGSIGAGSIGGGGSGEDIMDYSLFQTLLLKPFTRIIIVMTIGVIKRVLFDGFITHYQVNQSDSPGSSSFIVTGEDYSILMDMIELSLSHPAQPDIIIVRKLIARYGLIPIVIPPINMKIPNPVRDIPHQLGTDLSYIQQLAGKYNYIFYVEPTEIPGANTAYWGPSVRIGIPQRAITVNMGSASNATSISIQNNYLEPKGIIGFVEDENLENITIPVIIPIPLPPFLARQPAHIFNQPFVKLSLFKCFQEKTTLDAYIRGIAEVDASRDVVTVSGELDTLRYGDILRSRKLVSLRGVGSTHDGLYYVKSVTHKIEKGSYKQNFTLAREGKGSIIPGVIQ